MIHLVDVYSIDGNGAIRFLYDLLAERKVSESISHKRHPTYVDHAQFVKSRPYLGWYIIQDDDELIGSCYITKYREVGIWLMPSAKGKGAGKAAMKQLLAKHPGRVFTNTSIHNPSAFAFYEKCGFRHCANMLECDNVPSGSDHTSPARLDTFTAQGVSGDSRNTSTRMDDPGGESIRTV